MINNQADLWSPDRFTGFPVGLAGPVGPYTSPLIRLVHKSRGVMDGFDSPNCFHRLDDPINRKPRRVSADRVSLAPPATTNSLLLRSSNPLPISLS